MSNGMIPGGMLAIAVEPVISNEWYYSETSGNKQTL
jgi:hypothetical protein